MTRRSGLRTPRTTAHSDPRPGEWGALSVVRPLSGGNRNRAFEVSGPQGRFVLKSTCRSEAAIAWLEPVHSHAERSGIRVPRYLRSLKGNFVEKRWTLEEYIDGTPPEKQQWETLGLALKRFQRLTKSTMQRPGFASSRQLLAVDRGGDIDLRDMPDRLVAECRCTWRALEKAPQAVVHGDLAPGNVLFDTSGRPALIDWDEARVDATLFDDSAISAQADGVPTMHRAVLAWEIACSWRREPAYAARLTGKLLGSLPGA